MNYTVALTVTDNNGANITDPTKVAEIKTKTNSVMLSINP